MDSTEASHKVFPGKVLAHWFVDNFFVHDMGIDNGNVDAMKKSVFQYFLVDIIVLYWSDRSAPCIYWL